MDPRHNLTHEVSIFTQIKDRLAVIHDLDKEHDAETLADTAAGETSIEEAIAEVLREADATRAMASGLGEKIKIMDERKARLDHKVERLRAIASWAMAETGLKKIQAPDMTISLSPGKPKLVIVDEGAVAAEFLKQIVTTKVDKTLIQAAVDSGNVPDGVEISNAQPVLRVSVR